MEKKKYNCEICKDSGYLRRAGLEWYHDDFGKLVRCECNPKKKKKKKKKPPTQQKLIF